MLTLTEVDEALTYYAEKLSHGISAPRMRTQWLHRCDVLLDERLQLTSEP